RRAPLRVQRDPDVPARRPTRCGEPGTRGDRAPQGRSGLRHAPGAHALDAGRGARDAARTRGEVRMANRGEYRAIHVALIDDPDFLQLSPPARLALMTLKLILGASGIDVVRALVPELMATTGYDDATIRAAVDELTAGRWILIEGRVVWLRNGLRFEPSKPLASENGRKGISAHLKTLPRVALVNRFADYYGLPRPFPELDEPAGPERATDTPSDP